MKWVFTLRAFGKPGNLVHSFSWSHRKGVLQTQPRATKVDSLVEPSRKGDIPSVYGQTRNTPSPSSPHWEQGKMPVFNYGLNCETKTKPLPRLINKSVSNKDASWS